MANTVLYGFYSLKDVMNQRVTDVGIEQVRTAVVDTLAEYNRQTQEMMSLLVERTTGFQTRFYLPGSGTLQPLDQWGNPFPVQEGSSYDIGFPIQGGGTAWGTNRVSRAKMTVEEAQRETANAIRRDGDWVRRHILATIFTNVSWTFADEEHGNLTIKGLANNDTDKFSVNGGAPATDQHYLAQANAIGAGADNPFPTIYTELSEHPANGDRIVSFVNPAQVAAVQALADFLPPDNSRVAVGNAADRLISGGEDVIAFGQRYIGYVADSNVDVVEWKDIPANYILSVAVNAPEKVVKMREYEEPALQGLFPEFHSPDGNLNINRFIRYAGFGGNNRVGATVTRLGNASYAIPTSYTAPLSV